MSGDSSIRMVFIKISLLFWYYWTISTDFNLVQKLLWKDYIKKGLK